MPIRVLSYTICLLVYSLILVIIFSFDCARADGLHLNSGGVYSYRNYGVLANPGLKRGSDSFGQNFGYETVPGIVDPFVDPRLKPLPLSFLTIPSQYVQSFNSSNKLDLKKVIFAKSGLTYLPVLPSSEGVHLIIHDTLSPLISTTVSAPSPMSALRLESRSHIFLDSKGIPLKLSAKSSGDYESMIGPGNPDTFKPFSPGLAIWGVLTSDYFERRIESLHSKIKSANNFSLLPDRECFWLDTDKIPGFRDIPYQDITYKKLVENTAWSFRDLSGLKQKYEYVTEFTATHKTVGTAIAFANGYEEPIDFWIEASIKPLARTLARILLFTGVETFSLHGQNKTYEFDSWMRPTGRVLLKDASDFVFRESTLNSLQIPYPEEFKSHQKNFPGLHEDMKDKLVDASFHNAGFYYSAKSPEIQSRLVFLSTAFENRGGYDHLYYPNHAKIKAAFYIEAISEISNITGVPVESVSTIAKVHEIEGYYNIYFDTHTQVWKDIVSGLKNPQSKKTKRTPFRAPSENEIRIEKLLAVNGPVPESKRAQLKQLIEQDVDAAARVLALKIAKFQTIEPKTLDFMLTNIAMHLDKKKLLRLGEILNYPKIEHLVPRSSAQKRSCKNSLTGQDRNQQN